MAGGTLGAVAGSSRGVLGVADEEPSRRFASSSLTLLDVRPVRACRSAAACTQNTLGIDEGGGLLTGRGRHRRRGRGRGLEGSEVLPFLGHANLRC